MSIKDSAKKLKTALPAVYIVLQKKQTPLLAKLFALLTVGYALSPIDLIPDFIPVLGYLDDLLILPILIAITIKLIPNELWQQALIESENLWSAGKPKRWYYSIPIVIIWLLIILAIIKGFK